MSVAYHVELYQNRIYECEGLRQLIALMRAEEKCVLDVGAGSGGNAKLMRERGKEVHALTLSDAEALLLRDVCNTVQVLDLESDSVPKRFPPAHFDAIVCSHVLEHLRHPERCLMELSGVLRPGGRIYVVLPNLAFYRQRIELLVGSFEYSEFGLLDRTHLRFFTYHSARRLVAEAGYRVVAHQAVGWVPLWPVRRWVGYETWLDRWGCQLAPNLFGWHILIVGEKCEESRG